MGFSIFSKGKGGNIYLNFVTYLGLRKVKKEKRKYSIKFSASMTHECPWKLSVHDRHDNLCPGNSHISSLTKWHDKQRGWLSQQCMFNKFQPSFHCLSVLKGDHFSIASLFSSPLCIVKQCSVLQIDAKKFKERKFNHWDGNEKYPWL